MEVVLISLVLPGVFDVLASFLLFDKQFINDDFPTFERPNKGNSLKPNFGHCESFSALCINFACIKLLILTSYLSVLKVSSYFLSQKNFHPLY